MKIKSKWIDSIPDIPPDLINGGNGDPYHYHTQVKNTNGIARISSGTGSFIVENPIGSEIITASSTDITIKTPLVLDAPLSKNYVDGSIVCYDNELYIFRYSLNAFVSLTDSVNFSYYRFPSTTPSSETLLNPYTTSMTVGAAYYPTAYIEYFDYSATITTIRVYRATLNLKINGVTRYTVTLEASYSGQTISGRSYGRGLIDIVTGADFDPNVGANYYNFTVYNVAGSGGIGSKVDTVSNISVTLVLRRAIPLDMIKP